jgi:Methylase involved in ubiquinone/menaquinone biosynthesis
LRNITHKEKALTEIRRVLRPGGMAMILEFSQAHKKVAPLYDFYSFKVLPKLGGLVTKDEASYRYLAESIRVHPDQETLSAMMIDAGFQDVEYCNMMFGVAAVHLGVAG